MGIAALPSCAAPTSEVSYLITEWSHERPVVAGAEVVAPGIDLDGHTDDVESEPCTGALDFVSPSGRRGIDNQYATALVSWLDAALGDLSSHIEMSPGHHWVMDIEGIDDLRDQVDVAIYVAIEAGGPIEEGGTVRRGELVAERTATLRDEWLVVDLGSLPLPMGERIGARPVDHATMRLRLFPERMLVDEVDGELGASVALTTVLAVSQVFEPGLDLPSAERMAMPDLDWDGDGVCEAASLGVGFHAVRLP